MAAQLHIVGEKAFLCDNNWKQQRKLKQQEKTQKAYFQLGRA